MSTKQTVIFTFMIVFLGVMLYALGAWFYWSSELGSNKRMLEALGDRKAELELVLDGTNGLNKVITDPEKGLKIKLDAAKRQAVQMEGNEAGGAKAREILYTEKEKELVEKWGTPTTGAQVKWKNLYTEWTGLNKKINDALLTLRKQKKDKDEKIVLAQTELDAELNNENVERTRTVGEKKKMGEELSGIRVAHEEVLEKISSVMRESQRKNEIVPQGEIINVAMDLKLATINRGAVDGLRKGLVFDIYSKVHTGLVKKGRMEIVDVRPSSADGLLLPPKSTILQDPQTGWVANDPAMRFSPYSGAGPDDSHAQPLEKPKSKADRIEEYRREKVDKELSATGGTREGPNTPPTQMGAAFAPIIPGDWINNPDFVPIVPEAVHQKNSVNELLAMKDVNISTLTFYFTESVRPYRQEFLKRLCERNACKTTDTMSAEVNYVVSVGGATRRDLVEREIESYKDKGEEVNNNIKTLRKTYQALVEGEKFGAGVLADDEMESFFTRRQRKQELLRGKNIQPGQHIFFVAGETQQRSSDELKKFIAEHNGVVANELTAKVDYVVAGAGLDKDFFEKVKRLGLKVIREDELPRFFGLE